MILGRLQVREKLNLLVVIPLVLVALLLVPLLTGRVGEARVSAHTSSVAAQARQLSVLVQELQQARLLAVARLRSADVAPNALIVQLQLVEDQRTTLEPLARENGNPALLAALDGVRRLVGDTGPALVGRSVPATDAIAAFGTAVDELVSAAALTQQTTVEAADAWALSSLDSLLRSNESVSRGGALLLAATGTTSARARSQLLAAAAEYFARGDDAGLAFQRQATDRAARVFGQATDSISAARIGDAQAQIGRSAEVSDSLPVTVFAAVQSQTELRQLVQTEITQGVATAATAAAQRAQVVVLLVSLLATLLMALVIALSVIVGRSVSRPLRRLTTAAAVVADLAQEELLRVADEDAQVDVVPQLAEIDISSDDEIGELAQAFNRVQSTAAQLLERQVVSRRNVASMFASVGRRTTNLVGRQLSLIDSLERIEDDPDTLSTLYRLDHLSTRLRRNANSLVVLSGGSESSGESRPVALSDAVRASLGSVEDYKRVTVDRLPDAYLSPGVVSDLLLLLAELLENAVLFSPPRTTVDVHGRLEADGACLLTIVDHGMGMPEDRLAEENARLERRERLDLAPTNVLGLFVVGRIARRHGLDVRLEPTPEHGITVRVLLPAEVLVDLAPNALPAARPEELGTRSRPERVPVPAPAGGPAPPSAPPPPVPPAGPAAAAPVTPVEDEAVQSTGAQRPIARRVPGAHWAAGGGGDPVSPPPPPPPSGATGVRRRVPGSHLPTIPDAAPPAPTRGGPDPDEARRQVAEIEEAMVRAEGNGPDPHTAAATSEDLARRAGVRRRIPGAALEELGGTAPPAPAPLGPVAVDPEAVRAALDDVGSAVGRAGEVRHRTSLNEERLAEEAASQAAAAEAAAREAALREAAGRRDEQRQAVTELAGELRATPPALPPRPVVDEPPRAAPSVQPAAPERPARRVPGASLAALSGAVPEVTRPANGPPTGPITLGAAGGRVVHRPERPEDVLSWVEDLELAMAEAAPPGSDAAGPERNAPHEPEDGESA